MGMFDELRCEYPLPDGWQPARLFQTKDTPDQWMATYVLRADGTLWRERPAPVEPVAYHGALTFYTSNIAGASRAGYMTNDETPPWCAEYVALFDHGTLLKLEGAKAPVTARPWLTKAAFFTAGTEPQP